MGRTDDGSFNPNIQVPSQDIVLGALNHDVESLEKLLLYYEPYIRNAASLSVTNSVGIREGTYISDDLAQDMMLHVIRAVDTFREKLLAEIRFSNQD